MSMMFDELFPGINEKSIPEILGGMSNQELIKTFNILKDYPQKMQELVLQDILKHAQNSQIGRNKQFSDIKSIKDFREKLPITDYGSYKPYIETMTTGEKDTLFNGDTVRFVATSGTTGFSKLIPESHNGETVKALVSRIRLILLMSLAPEIMAPDQKVLSISNPAEYDKTEANIPIGSASGQAVKDIPKEMQQKLILPVELILAKNLSNEAMDYLIILFALAEENLAGVVCSNIAHFDILLHKMNHYVDDLLVDIEKGEISPKIEIDESLKKIIASRLTPNPKRAEKLQDIYRDKKTFDVATIWPHFSVVSCWMSASSERIVKDVRRHLPAETKFLEWGYGASEGKFNIPSRANDPSGDLALFGYFFEFLPLGGTDTVLAHELKQGEYYELIITTYSGLYRYNMKDIVYVKDIENHCPRIVFASKTTERFQLDDFEMYVYEMDNLIKKASEQMKEEIRFYQIIIEDKDKDKDKRLVFIIEPISKPFQGEAFIKALENILRTHNSIYSCNREKQQINALEMIIVEQGYRDALFLRSIMPGKNVNQTKLKTIVNVYPEEGSIINRFRGDD